MSTASATACRASSWCASPPPRWSAPSTSRTDRAPLPEAVRGSPRPEGLRHDLQTARRVDDGATPVLRSERQQAVHDADASHGEPSEPVGELRGQVHARTLYVG